MFVYLHHEEKNNEHHFRKKKLTTNSEPHGLKGNEETGRRLASWERTAT